MSIISQENQKNLIKVAQQYIIDRGWAVIPGILTLENGSKKVDLRSGYWNKDAEKGLDDPYLVADVFKDKNALGVVTGFKSGITVLDLDTNKNPKSVDFGKPVTPLSTFPPTYTVKTQSGGYHLYYQYYSDITNKAEVGGDSYHKVDCRNDGGFVFAPPTEINGKQAYEIVNDMEPQPFPVEMFKGIKTSKKSMTKFKGLHAIKVFKVVQGAHLTCSVLCDITAPIKTAPDAAEKFAKMVLKYESREKTGLVISIFNPAGQDSIGGGCGQLLYVQDRLRKIKE